MGLGSHEQETIINFNKGESTAYLFTYERTWQQHLENKLGLKPTMTNSFGGRGYELDKKRISMPRAPRKLTPEARMEMAKRLSKMRRDRILPSENSL